MHAKTKQKNKIYMQNAPEKIIRKRFLVTTLFVYKVRNNQKALFSFTDAFTTVSFSPESIPVLRNLR